MLKVAFDRGAVPESDSNPTFRVGKGPLLKPPSVKAAPSRHTARAKGRDMQCCRAECHCSMVYRWKGEQPQAD